MRNLTFQVLTVKTGSQDETKTTEQLQIKYARLEHPVMQRNFPLKVEPDILFFSSSLAMMLSDFL